LRRGRERRSTNSRISGARNLGACGTCRAKATNSIGMEEGCHIGV